MLKIRVKNVFLPVCLILIILILSVNATAFIKINDVDFTSPGRSREVKPNEAAELTFEIENTGEEKIEDIEVLVYFERNSRKLDDNNGDDFELETEIDYIRGDRNKDVEFKFNIPFDVEDGEIYTIVVEVEGKNSTDNEKYTDRDTSEDFEIIREKHELLFYKLDISPTTISCDRTITVHYDIRNIGQRDEDINLTIVNNIFDINLIETFDLEEEYDEDNKWEKSHFFDIPSSVALGTYGLTVNLYYDGDDEHQYNTTNIVVEECGGQTTTDDTGTTDNDTTGDTTDTTDDPDVEVIYTQPVTSTTYPAVAPPKKTGMDTTVILIVAAIMVILLLIVILVVVLSRK